MYPSFFSFWVRLCFLLSHLFQSSLKLIFRFHEFENGGNSEEEEKDDNYQALLHRDEQEDSDGRKNGGLGNTIAELDTTVPSGESGSNKYKFVSSGEVMTGFVEEPRILKFTVYEAPSLNDDEEKNLQGDEFDAENGWDFFDRSLIDKVQKRSTKFIDDDYDDTTESPGEEEEEKGFGYEGFSTDEESESLGFELISETASTEEELISEIEGFSDLGETGYETGEGEEKKETVEETEKTEDSVSGLAIEEAASGERLTEVQNSFRNEEDEKFPTENCVPPIKEYHFFPYRAIYEGSEPENLGASIDEQEVEKMESVQPPESNDSEAGSQQHEDEEDDYSEDEEEFIEFDPRNRASSTSSMNDQTVEQEPIQQPEPGNPVEPSIEETAFFSSYENEEDDTDALWEHCDIVEQLKMELRQARTGGLPTILEESEETGEESSSNSSPKVAQELKPMKIDDDKFEYKDLIDSIHKVYRNYSDRMKKLDILNFQTMHAAGLLQLKEAVLSQPPRRYSIPAMKSAVLHNWCKLGKVAAEPMRKIVADLQRDFEVVYVGQLCLSWELLHWQFWKSLELMRFDSSSRSSHRYNQVAGEFQLFQVLVQRFVENEPFQGPNRVQTYVKDRCVVRNLLQVPMIKEDSLKEEKEKEHGDYELVITSELLAETIDRSMRLFWEFLRNENTSLLVSQPHIDPNDQDTTNSEFFQEVRTEFHKKDKKLKEILKTGNCLLRKFQRNQGSEECSRQREVVVAQVELKLVSRVLSMSSVTIEQLIWCHEKLGKVRLSNRKVFVEPSFLLFPC